MRREGEEEKWYFQDVKKDVKSSPFLCHWQFFLKAKTKSQHSEYTASIQLLLNDTGLYFLPYCYLANTLIAYIFNGASSDFTLGIWCMTNSIYGTSARNNDKSCYEYPRIHKCTAITSGRKLHILGKKKNVYQLISINGLGHESFPKERTWPLDAEERRIWAVLSLVGLRTKSLAIERGL